MPRRNKAGIGSARMKAARGEYRRVRWNAWKRAQRAGQTRAEFRADFPTLADLDKSGRGSLAIIEARVQQEKAGAPARGEASTANLKNQTAADIKSPLSWEPGAYSIESLRAGVHSEKEMRAEYGRLLKILKGRAQRIEASGEFEYRLAPYNMRLERYITLSEIPKGPEGERSLIYGLRELAWAAESPMSSLTGLRAMQKTSLETLHEHGYKFVTPENFEQFARFMELARIMGMNRLYDSKRVAEEYKSYKKNQLTETEMLDRFQEWVDQQPAAKQASQYPVSSERARRSIL